MIQFFRNIIFSKIGAGVTIAFLVLIALAFASGDVLNLGSPAAIQSSDEVAKVGSHRITAAEYEKQITAAFERAKQENPALSIKSFVALGGGDLALQQLIDRAAILAFGQKHRIVAGDRLIGSELAKQPMFQGVDGKFNQKVYEQWLIQQRLTDKFVRDDLTASLVAQQVQRPAEFGATFSQEATLRYAALLREHRKGAIALLPAQLFAPKALPSAAEVAAFYNRTRNNYLQPERRVLRYAFFDASAVKTAAPPSETEIVARYNANKSLYAASQKRRIVQLIVPTEAAARAILAETAKGVSLEAAAKSKGLGTTSVTIAKEALASQASPALADAAYAAEAGRITGPAKSGLGWHLLRVDAIETKPARTLDQVRPELTKLVAEQKQRQALSDFSARIEEEFDNGSSLSDVAKELSVTPTVTDPITADGKAFGNPGRMVSPEVAKIVQAAFAMDRENKPQLAEIEAGKKFVIFDVTNITAAAPAPLIQIKQIVMQELLLEKGQLAAKAAAERVLAATKKGTDLATAVAQLGVAGIPPVDQVDMGRQELTAQGNKQIPPPLALLFSMAQGTVKLYPAPRNRGWYLVGVRQITPGAIAASDPEVAQARKDLGQLAGREYVEQLRRAIRAEVGVTRKDSAIKAARNQVSGGS